MNPSGPTLRAIITINMTLLYAAFLAALAWYCWPDTAEGWRLGLFSILAGLGAFGLGVKGIGDIGRFVLRDLEIHRFHARGRAPHSDKLADDDALRKSEMVE